MEREKMEPQREEGQDKNGCIPEKERRRLILFDIVLLRVLCALCGWSSASLRLGAFA
jgi:hypothetical protein